jgi:phosphate:Na+ symporter
MQKEIVVFITRIMQKNLPIEMVEEGRQQLRIADEYESIGDYIITLLKLNDRLAVLKSSTAGNDILNVKTLHSKISHYLSNIGGALATGNADIITKATSEGLQITKLAKQFRDEHLAQIEHAKSSPQQTLIIIDMLQSYRKIRAHAMNIAEAIAGEK